MRARSPSRSRAAVWVLAGACVLAAVIVAVAALGVGHTLIILGVLVGIGLVTLAGTEWVLATRRHRHAASLSTQLAIVVGLVMAPVVLALIILGLVMFVSGADAALVAVIVALSAVVGTAASARLAGAISADVATIRDGLVAVGQGDRSVRMSASSASELAELADQASAMICRLAQEETARKAADAARRELVAHASHDLRTPVTSLALLARAIDDEVVDGEVRREYVGRMLTHIDALSALIDDLFELSRIQAGDVSWTLEPVAIGDLISETVAAMHAQAEAWGVRVQAELPHGAGPVRGHPDKLQRVLFNLIHNAIRHSPPDASVVVRAERLGDRVEVEVEDRGPGIPAAERPLIFEAFYRGPTDVPRPADRAGLGLAVARAIVDAHGGAIWLADAETGTRVRFSVPVAD